MKRQLAKGSVADKKMTLMRGSTAKSTETKLGKSKANQRVRAFSIEQKPSPAIPNSFRGTNKQQYITDDATAKMEFSQRGKTTGRDIRNPNFDETVNSYAKQMQSLDDTQYQTAIMREARQQHMIMEAARAVS